jgi:hypothetical protein
MTKANALSAIGRMSYGAHLCFYPTAFGFYTYVIAPHRAASAAAAIKSEIDTLSAARPVDPDLFSPFTPIPYHNNPELTYVYSGINMRNYVNSAHINEKDYVWKNYHNSFDHGNKQNYKWNWSRVE